MQAPVDYPINDHARNAQFSVDELTYAALLDRMDTLDACAQTALDKVIVDTPDFSGDDKSVQATTDQSLLQPLTSLARNLLARDAAAGDMQPVFSKWSRALR